MTAPDPPLALLAELTHRCPLQCPYCSNPVELVHVGREIDTPTWCRVLDEAQELGILQVHFSGGEPTVRRDLEELVEHAAKGGLYTNLITAGVLLDAPRIEKLAEAGLDHIQLSLQDSEAENADRISGYPGGLPRKLKAARLIREAGLPLTLNIVVHRQNLHHLGALIDLGAELDAERVEIAHVQYYGWGYRNRGAFMPTRDQVDAAVATVEAARERYRGRFVIEHVVPDYHARRPKACMGGWGRRFLNVTPEGRVLPCHAAETITGLDFESVTDRGLGDIWRYSSAFERFRGTGWMPEPCKSCERREIDWGGCRCQAFALTGDAANTDPACELSPRHEEIVAIAREESAVETPPEFIYRRFANAQPAAARRSRG